MSSLEDEEGSRIVEHAAGGVGVPGLLTTPASACSPPASRSRPTRWPCRCRTDVVYDIYCCS